VLATSPIPGNAASEGAARRRLLACVLPALFLPFVASVFYFVLLENSPVTRVAYALTKLFTIAWPLIAVFLIERRPRTANRGDRWRALPLGLLTGVIIGGAILLAYHVPALHAYARGFAGDIRGKLADLGVHTRGQYFAFCAFLAVIHSLIEEYYWRWYVFGSLARVWPLGISSAVASLAFAGHHYVVLGCYFDFTGAFVFGSAVGVGGALWCWMFQRQRTLAGTWLSHGLVDAAIFLVGYDLIFA
jgi:membrane protease YdiL (CAAX protease family)